MGSQHYTFVLRVRFCGRATSSSNAPPTATRVTDFNSPLRAALLFSVAGGSTASGPPPFICMAISDSGKERFLCSGPHESRRTSATEKGFDIEKDPDGENQSKGEKDLMLGPRVLQ